MIAPSNKVDLSSHLTLLCILMQVFGFSDFNYSRSARQVEFSRSRSRKSQIVLKVLTVVCGIIFVLMLYASTQAHLKPLQHLRNVDVQESVLRNLSYAAEYLSVMILAVNCMRFRRSILLTANEMFDIFKALQRKSDSRIFFPAPIAVFLIFKVALFCLSLLSGIGGNLTSLFIFLDVTATYGHVLHLLMFMGYAYSQLVLVCFYTKMDEILQLRSSNKDQLAGNIRQFLTISFRIHQVNRSLNAFFSALFLSTFFGLFSDTDQLYRILKVVFYHKFNENRILKIGEYILHVNWRPLLILRVSYDMYLFGRLSDMLVQSEKAFKKRMMLLIYKMRLTSSTQLQLDIYRLRIQSHLYDMNYRRPIRTERGLTFYLIIVISVTTFLHFYATDLIRI